MIFYSLNDHKTEKKERRRNVEMLVNKVRERKKLPMQIYNCLYTNIIVFGLVLNQTNANIGEIKS
jgi:hypothetical protein